MLEISINTKDLSHALNQANSVVEKRNVLELSHIKLTASDDKLEISATDMDLFLKQSLSAQILSNGEITVSAPLLTEIIRKISDETVNLVEDKNNLYIKGKNYQFQLLTLPSASFPTIKEFEIESRINVSAKKLIGLFEATIFSISTDETRYNLNGVYLHIRDGHLKAASTDGHRLSLASTKMPNAGSDFGLIIPRKTVLELIKLLKSGKNIQSEIIIEFCSNKIRFMCGDTILISKLIDAEFPDYGNFIPKNNSNILNISTQALGKSIDRVATVTVEKFRAVKFFIEQSHLVISASGEAKGQATETIEYNGDNHYQGENLSIGFNPKYWNDIFSAINQEKIKVAINDYSMPILVTPIDNGENVDCSFVIMPVKI